MVYQGRRIVKFWVFQLTGLTKGKDKHNQAKTQNCHNSRGWYGNKPGEKYAIW